MNELTTEEWTDFVFWKFDNYDISEPHTPEENEEIVKIWKTTK